MSNDKPLTENITPEFWFPGRWVGGASLIIGPVLLLLGTLLRIQFDFFFPQQLAAFQTHPKLIIAAYSCFLAGNILLWPGILTVARLIGKKRPGWALWGGSFVMFGLFARTFHAGADHFALQLVRSQNLELATKAVANSYGAFHIVSSLNGLILFGWIVLAIGAYLSGTLGLLRSIALGLMAGLMMGVLKGSSIFSIVTISGLCIALVPLGVKVLRNGPTPSYRAIFGWSVFLIGFVLLLFFLGQAG